MPKQFRVVERITLLVEHFVAADTPEEASEIVQMTGGEEYDRLMETEESVIVSVINLEDMPGRA